MSINMPFTVVVDGMAMSGSSVLFFNVQWCPWSFVHFRLLLLHTLPREG